MKRYVMLLILVASFLFAQTASADLVQNGGFESGDFTHWTQSGNTGFTFVSNELVNSGSNAAKLGPTSEGYLSQSISTTDGASYELTFFLANRGIPDSPATFEVYWNGVLLNTLTSTSVTNPFTEYDFTVNGASNATSTELKFGFIDVIYYSYLDDVSVDPVPVPPTVWLFGSGLLGLAGWRRFRKG